MKKDESGTKRETVSIKNDSIEDIKRNTKGYVEEDLIAIQNITQQISDLRYYDDIIGAIELQEELKPWAKTELIKVVEIMRTDNFVKLN